MALVASYAFPALLLNSSLLDLLLLQLLLELCQFGFFFGFGFALFFSSQQ